LLGHWVRRKIRRDRMAWAPDSVMNRLLVDEEGLDTETVIDRLMSVMEATALRMVHRDGQGIALTETIDEHVVAEEVERFLPIPGASVLGVLLNSVLVSAGNRQGSTLRIGFLYRVLQEYFVAAALARQGLSADGFPGEVPALHGEITFVSPGSFGVSTLCSDRLCPGLMAR